MGEKSKTILVLGVGNILMHDEGLGVRVVEHLAANYEFSENVELMDGGAGGLRLTEELTQHDCVVIVDAVQNGGAPGDLYRLEGDDLKLSLTFKQSMHETDLLETLACCEIIGHRPNCVVLGMEPLNIEGWSLELTPPCAAALPGLIDRVLDEIRALGGEVRPKQTPTPSQAPTRSASCA
ncbi:MAG: HyaD/HybD family hydrogenase maturation endopeptidase [Thermodesulfobacteriota bacterium]